MFRRNRVCSGETEFILSHTTYKLISLSFFFAFFVAFRRIHLWKEQQKIVQKFFWFLSILLSFCLNGCSLFYAFYILLWTFVLLDILRRRIYRSAKIQVLPGSRIMLSEAGRVSRSILGNSNKEPPNNMFADRVYLCCMATDLYSICVNA